MIPRRLIISNFLSYRDAADLDLRGVHLACIAGPNGAGKSSILDAITWALFGKSRTGNEDMVVNRHAARDNVAAEVLFDFELEGEVYRIRRRRQAGKTAELELQLLAGDSDEQEQWLALTEARLRETQAVVEDVLKMSYDIFTNASFLLQGQADEFTTKTPNRRKEILADILGVSRWDEYRDSAAERRKGVESETLSFDRQLEDVRSELAEAESRQQALGEAREREQALAARRDAQEALVSQMRQTRALVEQQRQLLVTLKTNRDRAAQELREIEAQVQRRRAELGGFEALIDQRSSIESRHAAWQKAEADVARWQALADEFHQLGLEKQPYEMAIVQASSRLAQQRQQLEEQRDEVAAAMASRAELDAVLVAERSQLEDLQRRLELQSGVDSEWQDLYDERQRLESDQRLWRQELDQLLAREDAVNAARQERERVRHESGLAEVEAARLATDLESLVVQQQRLRDAHAEREGRSEEQLRLRREMDAQKERIKRLADAHEEDCPLCGRPLTEAHRATVVQRLNAEGTELGNRYRENRARVETLDEEVQHLTVEIKRLPALERERDAQRQRAGRAEARLLELERQVGEWESQQLTERRQELESRLGDDAGLAELNSRLASLETTRDERKQLERDRLVASERIAHAEARLEQIIRLAEAWEVKGSPQLADVRRQLETDAYAREERTALAEVEARQLALGFDATAFEDARQRRVALADAVEAYQQLQQAAAAVSLVQDSLTDLLRRRDQTEARQTELESQLTDVMAMLAELEISGDDWRSAQEALDSLREEVLIATRAVGAAQQRVAVLDDLRGREKVLLETIKTHRERVRRLKLLEEACGRNGVQALLIESALPELEEQANDLLDRLTDGEMRVSFETQRQLKTQDRQAETLEIKISDSSGERPYENYSGGEKFRVNFAIRLALSQVLARRAGARLRMLVIDEGFGSQDPEGRQRLVEAINVVQSQFACILIITHIDELRDKFPARIDVEKTPRGSRLTLTVL